MYVCIRKKKTKCVSVASVKEMDVVVVRGRVIQLHVDKKNMCVCVLCCVSKNDLTCGVDEEKECDEKKRG